MCRTLSNQWVLTVWMVPFKKTWAQYFLGTRFGCSPSPNMSVFLCCGRYTKYIVVYCIKRLLTWKVERFELSWSYPKCQTCLGCPWSVLWLFFRPGSQRFIKRPQWQNRQKILQWVWISIFKQRPKRSGAFLFKFYVRPFYIWTASLNQRSLSA